MDNRGEAHPLSRTPEIEKVFKNLETTHPYRELDRRRQDEMTYGDSELRPSEDRAMSEAYGPDRVFNNEPMKSKHDSVLNQNYQYLADNIERLFVKVENLEQRLKIILIDGEPESVRDSMGYAGNTALSENLASLCRRTQDLSDRLEYLTARIDL